MRGLTARKAVWLFPLASNLTPHTSHLTPHTCSRLFGFSPEGGTRTAGVREPPDSGRAPAPLEARRAVHAANSCSNQTADIH
jgi:hypothetical protein